MMKGIKKHPLLAVIIRETERIKHNPAYIFLLFTGPLIGIFLLFFIFQQGVVKDIPIALVDQDQSSLSIKMANALNASPDVELISISQDIFRAKDLMESGLVEAIIIIPDDVNKSIYQGIEAQIPIYINGTNVLKAGIIQRSVLTSLKTISAGIQLKQLMLSGTNQKDAEYRIMPVSIDKHILFNPYTNYNYFLNSAMLYVMLFLFVFLSSIYTLGNELKRGSGKDLLKTSNNSVRIAVAGKMLPYTIIFTAFAMLINVILFKIEGLPLNGNYFIILLSQFICIITYQLMGLIFLGVTINLRLALSLGSAYTIMGVTFSGLTFPFEAMPLLAKFLGMLFPFTWWEKIMISQSLRGSPVSEVLPYICYILIFQLLSLCFLGVYKRYLGNSKYWGKK
jgi:ABC-2 type transport system permease protein